MDGLARSIIRTAKQIGVDPQDLATAMSYETGGTFDPWQKGPTTKWGQHRGLIQWGEPQRKQYGVDQSTSIADQVSAAGRYLVDAGVRPGMGLLDIYSAINAGGVGRYNASDANAGGAPGSVRDKVQNQMSGHKRNAARLLGDPLTQDEFESRWTGRAAPAPQAPQRPDNGFTRMALSALTETPERRSRPAPVSSGPVVTAFQASKKRNPVKLIMRALQG